MIGRMGGTGWMGRKHFVMALALAALCAGCSDPTPPAAPTPAAATITDTFTGTLNPFATNKLDFTVVTIGKIQVTVNSVVPSAAIGVAVGTPSVATGTCLAISSLTAVGGTDTQISGTATIVGGFCLSVSDVGNLVEPVTYTVTVVHS